MLVPPVSNARFSARGLPSTKLVGDSASPRMLAANSAFDASLALEVRRRRRVVDQARGEQVDVEPAVEADVVAPRGIAEAGVAGFGMDDLGQRVAERAGRRGGRR